jgi:hypothetical protein
MDWETAAAAAADGDDPLFVYGLFCVCVLSEGFESNFFYNLFAC